MKRDCQGNIRNTWRLFVEWATGLNHLAWKSMRVCFFVSPSVCAFGNVWLCWWVGAELLGAKKTDVLKIIKKHRLIACTAAPQHSEAVTKPSVWKVTDPPKHTYTHQHTNRREHIHQVCILTPVPFWPSCQAWSRCVFLTSFVLLAHDESLVYSHLRSYAMAVILHRITWISIIFKKNCDFFFAFYAWQENGFLQKLQQSWTWTEELQQEKKGLLFKPQQTKSQKSLWRIMMFGKISFILCKNSTFLHPFTIMHPLIYKMLQEKAEVFSHKELLLISCQKSATNVDLHIHCFFNVIACQNYVYTLAIPQLCTTPCPNHLGSCVKFQSGQKIDLISISWFGNGTQQEISWRQVCRWSSSAALFFWYL